MIKILSWNVNGLEAREEAVNRVAADLRPEFMCFQKICKQSAFLIQIPGYIGWLGTMTGGLFGGVSTYFRRGMPVDFTAQINDMPEWLVDSGCLNVLHLDDFILVNAYFPYANKSNDEFVKIRQQWDYELHEYLVKLANQKPIILCGDLNIVSEDIDAWDGVSVKNHGCFTKWEHRNFESMISATGLVDSYRKLHPNTRKYSYFFQNRPEYRIENQDSELTILWSAKN